MHTFYQASPPVNTPPALRLVRDEERHTYDVGQPPRAASRVMGSDRPLMFSPALATAVGLEGAVFLQQLHYWTSQPGAHERDGFRWVYNTIDQWLEQFPFWSRSALHRVISGLESKGVIVSTAAYNAKGSDRTKWYRINHDHADLQALSKEHARDTEEQNPSDGLISRIRDMDIANPENGISISRNRDLYKEHKTTHQTTTLTGDTPLYPPPATRPPKAKAKTSWPDGFTLTEQRRQVAIDAGIRPDRVAAVFEGMHDGCAANGYRYIDWDAAWRNWVKNPRQDHDRVGAVNRNNGHHVNGKDIGLTNDDLDSIIAGVRS